MQECLYILAYALEGIYNEIEHHLRSSAESAECDSDGGHSSTYYGTLVVYVGKVVVYVHDALEYSCEYLGSKQLALVEPSFETIIGCIEKRSHHIIEFGIGINEILLQFAPLACLFFRLFERNIDISQGL